MQRVNCRLQGTQSVDEITEQLGTFTAQFFGSDVLAFGTQLFPTQQQIGERCIEQHRKRTTGLLGARTARLSAFLRRD